MSKLQVGVHIPGEVAPQPPETFGISLHHIMLRIKDPARSLKFYTEGLGMRTVFTFDTGLWTIYYLGHPSTPGEPSTDMMATLGSRKGLLELYHIPYHPQSSYEPGNGNAPGYEGFGHIGFVAPNVKHVLERLLQVCPDTKVIKPLGDSDNVDAMQLPRVNDCEDTVTVSEGYRNIFKQVCFCKDPDGYIVELVPQEVEM